MRIIDVNQIYRWMYQMILCSKEKVMFLFSHPLWSMIISIAVHILYLVRHSLCQTLEMYTVKWGHTVDLGNTLAILHWTKYELLHSVCEYILFISSWEYCERLWLYPIATRHKFFYNLLYKIWYSKPVLLNIWMKPFPCQGVVCIGIPVWLTNRKHAFMLFLPITVMMDVEGYLHRLHV